MTRCEQIPLWCLLLLLFGADKLLANYCSDDELYVIRSTGSGGLLVLDGSDPPRIHLQYFTGFSPQLWQFKRASRAGLYYIINNHTNNALDFVTGEPTYIVMNKQKDTAQQHWILNSNGRIINAAASKNLEVRDAEYTSGKAIILVQDNATQAQEFDLQLKGVRPNLDFCKYLLR